MDGHAYYAASSGVFLQSTGQAIETNKRGGWLNPGKITPRVGRWSQISSKAARNQKHHWYSSIEKAKKRSNYSNLCHCWLPALKLTESYHKHLRNRVNVDIPCTSSYHCHSLARARLSGRDMASQLGTQHWTGSQAAIFRLLTADQRISAAGANRDTGGAGRGRDFPNTVSIQINNPVIDTSAAASSGPRLFICYFIVSSERKKKGGTKYDKLTCDYFQMFSEWPPTALLLGWKLNTGIFEFLPEEKSCGLNRCWNLSRILVSIVFWSSQVTRIHPDTGITVALHAANIITKVIIMIICRQKMEVNSK